MNILYVVSFISLLTVFMLLKKSDKQADPIKWFLIFIFMFYSFNSLIVFIYSIFRIPSTLFVFFLTNVVACSLLLIKIYIDRGTQKYSLILQDWIMVFLLLTVTVIILYLDFGFPLNIVYETTDPAVHFVYSKYFSEYSFLLDGISDKIDSIYRVSIRGPIIYYINCGLLFKLFEGIDKTQLYKVFIPFDIFQFFLSGAVFYCLLKPFVRNKLNFVFAMGLTVLYMLGYPLNILVFGFGYLIHGVTIIGVIIIVCKEIVAKATDEKYLLIILSLLLCGLFFSYHLFVPMVYSAIFVAFCYYYYREKILFQLKTMQILFFVIGVPFIIGCFYYIIPSFMDKFINSGSRFVSFATILSWDGYIYRNLYSDFIFLLPFIATAFKNRENNDSNHFYFEGLLILANFMFILLIFVLCLNGRASDYYFFKLYYPMWQISFYLFSIGVFYLLKVQKQLVISFGLAALFIFYMCFGGGDWKVRNINIRLNAEPKSRVFVDIYWFNAAKIIQEKPIIFNGDEIELLSFYEKNIFSDNPNNISVIAGITQYCWFYSMFNVYPKHTSSFYAEVPFDFEEWKNDSDTNLLIYFNRNGWLAENEIEFAGYETLYESSAGKIICK